MEKIIYPIIVNGEEIYVEAESAEFMEPGDDGVLTVSRSQPKDIPPKDRFTHALNSVHHIARAFVESVKDSKPDEMALEMGIKFEAGVGIPFIGKANSESTFRLTLKWKKDKNGDDHGSSD